MNSDKPKPHIAAIPTFYEGCWFRSRIEARWAVFFRFMKIAYRYEQEGYELSAGRYLPDFFLPEIGWWAEVKPMPPSANESARADELVLAQGSGLLWLIGPPDYKHYSAITVDTGMITECEYSLDIYEHCRAYYDCQRRLFSEPGPIDKLTCSQEFKKAVCYSVAERFGVFPMAGKEPFNLGEQDLREGWGL